VVLDKAGSCTRKGSMKYHRSSRTEEKSGNEIGQEVPTKRMNCSDQLSIIEPSWCSQEIKQMLTGRQGAS